MTLKLALPALLACSAPLVAQEVHSLVTANPTAGAWAGSSTEFGGGTVFCGAVRAILNGSSGEQGAVYTFDPVTAEEGPTFFNPNGSDGDLFGQCLAYYDGKLLVGAPGEEVGGLTRAGAVYLMDASTGQILRRFEDPHPEENGRFGTAVEFKDGIALIIQADISGEYWLHAFDTATGINLWNHVSPTGTIGGEGVFGIAGGRVYSVTRYYHGPDGWGAVMVHDLATGTLQWTIELPDALSLAVNDQYLAISRDLMPIAIYDPGTLQPLFQVPVTPGYEVWAPRLDLEGSRLAGREKSAQGAHERYFVYDLDAQVEIGSAVVDSLQCYQNYGALAGELLVRSAMLYDDSPGTQNCGRLVVMALGDDKSTSYCTAALNSTGEVGKLEGGGSKVASINSFWLHAWDLPATEFTLFMNAPSQAFVQNAGGSNGNLCLGGGIGSHVVDLARSSSAGAIAITVELNALPRSAGTHAVQPGETWNFQAWHRDGASSNFTEGATITFQ